MKLFPVFTPLKIKNIIPILIIMVIVISYSLFFILQNITETNIKDALLEQQTQRQIESTEAVAQHIGSDLDSIMARLKGLANSIYFQNSQLTTENARELVDENHNEIDHLVDRLAIINRNNTIIMNTIPEAEKDFVGTDLKFDWIKESQQLKKPVFSEGFRGLDGKYRIALAYPIINRDTAENLGLIVAVIPSEHFFAHYGNIHDISSRFLVVFDKNAVMLVNGASKDLVGKDFFGEYTQKFINFNPMLNNLTRDLLEGNFAHGIYDYGRGERITVQRPIYVNDMPHYFIQYVQPTQQIYSQVEDILFSQRIQTFLILATFTFIIITIMIFYIKWNSVLQKTVRKRTEELECSTINLKEANIRLERANEQLQVNDIMQKEFINVAAHELRTPTQVIAGFSQLALADPEYQQFDKQKGGMLYVINRNADRLKKLTEDILNVTRIESNHLTLNREVFDINEKIERIIDDFSKSLKNEAIQKNVELKFTKSNSPLFVNADITKIYEVLSNLIANSIKFVDNKEGKITISIDIEENNNQNKNEKNNKPNVVVSVKDNGKGIDSDIIPRLFTKFAAKSFQGTGLGLYISKCIIESHGGRMWAYNNIEGSGATFSFSLPLYINNANL